MSEFQHLPTPLYRNLFSLEIFPHGEPTVMEKTLLKLFDDLKFANWEVIEDNVTLTLGIEETEENIERIYRFIAAGREKQRIKQLTIHRENHRLVSKGSILFSNLKFKAARASIDTKTHEVSYMKIVLQAGDMEYGKKNLDESA